MRPDPPNPFDRSLKVLIRRVLPTLLRLAGVEVAPAQVHPDDTAINLPEHHADHLFRIGAEDDPTRWALHLEYQLQPDPRVLPDWLFKNAALNKLLPIPVVLMAVYLTRRDRATSPDTYTIQGGPLRNDHRFEVIRLWEHAERIRGGELPELAPLLVLCEDRPTEATLRQERELLLSLEVERPVRADLLAVAVMVGTRFFARELLEAIFREEMVMLKETSFITEWIDEAVAQAVARVEPEAEARARRAARRVARRVVRRVARRGRRSASCCGSSRRGSGSCPRRWSPGSSRRRPPRARSGGCACCRPARSRKWGCWRTGTAPREVRPPPLHP